MRVTLLFLTLSLAACRTGEEPVRTPTEPTEPADPAGELSVSLEATPLEGAAPLEVVFTATTTDYTADYLWAFGDDKDPVLGDATVTHTYAEPGRYLASVSVGSSEDLLTDAVEITVR